jgi:hypothetical protein
MGAAVSLNRVKTMKKSARLSIIVIWRQEYVSDIALVWENGCDGPIGPIERKERQIDDTDIR